MRLRISIWVIVILCCLALGIRQKEDLGLIWREYVSLGRDFEYDGSLLAPRKPLIRDSVARSDPEAAAIVEGQLRGYEEADDRINVLAENVIRFPDNELFLFRLACGLSVYRDVFDPQIVLLMAEKLINLDPKNANYRLLKAYALFNNRDGNDIEAALEELDYANKCSISAPLYEKYKKRTINIANKAKLSSTLTERLSWSRQRTPSFVFEFRWDLIRHAHLAFTNGNYTSGRHVGNSLYGMMKREIQDGGMAGWENPRKVGSIPHFGLWDLPQQLELQRAMLSDEEARQKRLELCALAAGDQKTREERAEHKSKIEKKQDKLNEFSMLTAAHCGKMVAALASAWLLLSMISLVCGFGQKSKVGFAGIILFLCGCLCYFLSAEGISIDRILWAPCCCYHYPFTEALRPAVRSAYMVEEATPFMVGPVLAMLTLWGLSFLKPAKGAFWRLWNRRFLIAVLIGAVLTALLQAVSAVQDLAPWARYLLLFGVNSFLIYMVIMFGWWLFKCRLVWFLAIAIPLGFLTFLMSGYTYLRYVPMILFAIIWALVAVNKPSNPKHTIKALSVFFSKKPEFAGLRRNCIYLTGIFIVVYWILFISLAPLLARDIKSYAKGYDRYDYKVSLPEANEATYQQVLSWFDKKDLDKNEVHGLISLIMPEDLPGVLEKLKEREFAKPSHMDKYYGPVASKRSKLKQANKLNDSDLIAAMTYCGRDVVSIIVDFMDNPQTERALVARARLGDITVKEKLEAIWKERMQDCVSLKEEYEYIKRKIQESGDWPHWKNVVFANDIVGALACISTPDEAAGRFLDFIEKQEVSDLTHNYEMFNNITLLPTDHALKVVKMYLAQVSNGKYLGEDASYILLPLMELDGLYADRQIAEDVLKIRFSDKNARNNYVASQMSPYLTIESSELLKRGLDSPNEDMRAWCVWQLRRIGYRWNKDEIDKLLADKSRKVRANAMLVTDRPVPEDEQSSFVKLIGTLVG
ncbi:MAG TPA: hypothetical protein HPP87_09455 [Planctomycetes bacterium]|nr:hypothetical protein [Planctomycetota bacterium]